MSDRETAPVRVWCDGCYDLVHFGHANSLRQAKALGDVLVVGVHSDAEIRRHKGPPVFSLEERCRMLAAVRWVDEVVPAAPYVTSLELLDRYECAFCCHGDDVTLTADGEDAYRRVKAAGRYRELCRTPGVSTTDLLDRVLGRGRRPPLLTAARVAQFAPARPPRPGEAVVYVAGDFDLLHVGHLQLLERASAMGDYLLVGLHSDRDVERARGPGRPVLGLHERLLGLLACRYVSDVLVEAPVLVTKELMERFKVDLVVGEPQREEVYKYPKAVGKFVAVDGSSLTTDAVVERIVRNKFEYTARNEQKERKERDLINELEERAK